MTVAEVIAELSKLPGYLPVAGVAYTAGVDPENGIVDEAIEERREVGAVRFEGRFVALECDGPYL